MFKIAYKILIIIVICILILFVAGCAGVAKPTLYAPLTVEFCAKKANSERAFCKKPFLGDTRTLPNSKLGNICMSTDDFVALVKFFRKYCKERPRACSWQAKSHGIIPWKGGKCAN